MVVASSPAVRLRISIKDKKVPEQEEIVGRSETGYEIVNVDGFVFRRKMRKLDAETRMADQVSTPVQPSMSVQSQQNPASTPAQPADPARTPLQELPVEHPTDEPMSLSRRTSSAIIQSGGNSAAILTEAQAPTDQQQCSTEEEQAQVSGEEDVSEAKLQLRSPESIAAASLARLPQGHLESEKLLDLCQLLIQDCQDGQFWESMTEPEVSSLLQSALITFREGIQEALQNGTLICSDPVQVKTSAQDVHKLQLAAKQKSLQQQLSQYEKEENEWKEILENMSSFVPIAEQASEPDSSAHVDTIQPRLQEDEFQAQARLSLQVDGLCAMMNGAEEILSKAEQLCKVMQAEYHLEKFMTFPHIDSPAKLIHEIVRPRQPRFMPASGF